MVAIADAKPLEEAVTSAGVWVVHLLLQVCGPRGLRDRPSTPQISGATQILREKAGEEMCVFPPGSLLGLLKGQSGAFCEEEPMRT